MKTNIVLSSSDRELFGTTIRQETKTGFLNLSDLRESYTQARVKNGWADKNITEILERESPTIFYLLERQGIITVDITTFMEKVKNEGFAKYMKSIGAYKTTGARETKTVWVNPYIFVMIAMELNPLFKANVIGWLTDQLIINRIEAGNFCKALNVSIGKFSPDGTQYMTLAKALNFIVFGKHEVGIRNTGTKEQLKELASIEEKMAFAIDMGYISSFDMLLEELRKMFAVKFSSQIK
jgi:hypothetical protein